MPTMSQRRRARAAGPRPSIVLGHLFGHNCTIDTPEEADRKNQNMRMVLSTLKFAKELTVIEESRQKTDDKDTVLIGVGTQSDAKHGEVWRSHKFDPPVEVLGDQVLVAMDTAAKVIPRGHDDA